MEKYEIIIPVYADGGINPNDIIGLLKGFSKAGRLEFLPPDEMQDMKRFLRFIVCPTKKSILNWQEQIRSYGINVTEVKP